MSLRVIHIFLMICAITLALFCALAIKLYAWFTVLSFVLAAVLMLYLVWFIRKTGKQHV